jgi:hypothetical protein
VLYSGAGTGAQQLEIERLRPNSRYQVRGARQATITADAAGRAALDVSLIGRTEIRLSPA